MNAGNAARLEFAKDSFALLRQWMQIALSALPTAQRVDIASAMPPHLDPSPPPLPLVGADLSKASPGNSSDRNGAEAVLQALEALMVVQTLNGRCASA